MRYTNPHTGQTIFMPDSQQQNTMQPNNQQMQPIMTPQGLMQPIMTPQGIMLMPIQSNNMQPMMQHNTQPMMQPNMQYNMQPNMPQQTNQAIIQPGIYQQPNMQPSQRFNQSSGRFQQDNKQEQQEMNQPTITPSAYFIKPTTHNVYNNDKFSIRTHTDVIKPSSFVIKEDNYVAVDTFIEAIESSKEHVYSNEDNTSLPMVTVTNCIIDGIFFNTDMNSALVEILDDNRILYKGIKRYFSEIKSKHQFAVLNSIDTILTDMVNDFVNVNSNISITIDSFVSDYNDLLKAVRDREEDLEDKITDYLDKRINEIKENYNYLEKTENTTRFPVNHTVVYIDKLLLETGLENVEYSFVKLEKAVSNVFINSIADYVKNATKCTEFIIGTLDNELFKCMFNAQNELYIKKI